jgi:hypothetical protein
MWVFAPGALDEQTNDVLSNYLAGLLQQQVLVVQPQDNLH